jgi:hypothetical protein
MIRGTVAYQGDSGEDDGYWKLAHAIIRRARLDADLQPEKYKNRKERRNAALYKRDAEEFLEWGWSLVKGDTGNGHLEHEGASAQNVSFIEEEYLVDAYAADRLAQVT